MRAVMLFVLLAAGVAEAGTRQPARTDQEHLAYGSLFSSVAKIHCVRQSDSARMTGSCVVVRPGFVITAAHVVEGTATWQIECGDQRSNGVEVFVHPLYQHDQKGTCDVALVRLQGDISLDYYPDFYEGNDEAGQVVSVAGYGLTGTMDAGYTISDGKRRAGSNIVERCEDGVLVCIAGGPLVTQLEYCISPGDSGGGLFVGRYLAGIHSYTSARGNKPPMSTWGNESSHTRLSLPEVRVWLKGVLNQ